jgi:hypothetical protein
VNPDPREVDPPCIHRGYFTGTTTCQTCGSANVKIKVYSCIKWGECTLKGPQPINGQICTACRDRNK